MVLAMVKDGEAPWQIVACNVNSCQVRNQSTTKRRLPFWSRRFMHGRLTRIDVKGREKISCLTY